MEQYVHTLIAANAAFAPNSRQVEEFFDKLVSSFHFRVISDAHSPAGLRVMKPSGRFRPFVSPFTGKTESFPISDHIQLDSATDIPTAIEGLRHYSVLISGEWRIENRPLVLLTTDGVLFDNQILCEVSCHLRPQLVSTSGWDIEVPIPKDVPSFGEPCESEHGTGVFSHPWTGEMIEVPGAGCARFWIEFEFGKFLLPKMGSDLDLLKPAVVASVEECFQTKFVQGCRFN